jgi:hypothetical protein
LLPILESHVVYGSGTTTILRSDSGCRSTTTLFCGTRQRRFHTLSNGEKRKERRGERVSTILVTRFRQYVCTQRMDEAIA